LPIELHASCEPDTVPVSNVLDTDAKTNVQPQTPDTQSELLNEPKMPLPDVDRTHKGDEKSTEDDVG
jgi:hypothetical protein